MLLPALAAHDNGFTDPVEAATQGCDRKKGLRRFEVGRAAFCKRSRAIGELDRERA